MIGIALLLADRVAAQDRPAPNCQQLKALHGDGLCIHGALKRALGNNRYVLYYPDGRSEETVGSEARVMEALGSDDGADDDDRGDAPK